MISFDSNILVYAADKNSGARHRTAVELIERAIGSENCIQPLQSCCEFFNVATRKLSLDPTIAAAFVAGWKRVIPVEPAIFDDFEAAARAAREHRLPFWDALLWATVRRTGVHWLISEDFQDGRSIDGVRIVNPFVAANSAQIEMAFRRW